MLELAHRKLEERLDELQKAIGAIVRERGGAAEIAAIDAVLAYLERSAARHEEDEELSFFPRLRGAPGSDLAPLLADLTAEHHLHRHLVGQLRSLRNRWPAAGPDAGQRASLVVMVGELIRTYRSHTEREDRELLPAARDRLTASDHAGILIEMDRRRLGHEHNDRTLGASGRRRYPAGSGPRIREL